MSKMLVKDVFIPKKIKILKKAKELILSSDRGTLKLEIPQTLAIIKQENFLSITSKTKMKTEILGTWYQQLKTALHGLARGYVARLMLKGVGYKVFINEGDLELKLGYSHLINYPLQKPTEFSIYKNNIINLKSGLKDKLGSLCYGLRAKREPDTYKGKGILFKGEKVLLKVGKKS